MQNLSNWLKKYFIPHQGNEFKPHFLRHKSMMVFLLGIFIVELGFLVQIFIVFDRTNFLASVLPAVLTSITNEERAQNNAPPLIQNDLLTKAAELKAQDMADKGYFAHNSPEGKTPWYWFEQAGYRFSKAGENLAVNFFESDEVARAWMDSPSHRANIVKKDYTEIGIGVANGIYQGRNTVFVVQLFGTPIQTFTPEKIPALPPKKAVSPTPKIVDSTPAPVLKAPVLTPPVVAIAPASTQILGEETIIPPTTATPNNSIFSNIKLIVQRILTSPQEDMAYAYGGITLLTTLAILLAIFINYKIQHPKIIARGLTLVAVIAFMLFLNIKIFHFETVVPSGNMTANAIESIN